MSTVTPTNLQTPVAGSGTGTGTGEIKGSAVFGAPQLSGDFLALLMGAFGNIVPPASNGGAGTLFTTTASSGTGLPTAVDPNAGALATALASSLTPVAAGQEGAVAATLSGTADPAEAFGVTNGGAATNPAGDTSNVFTDVLAQVQQGAGQAQGNGSAATDSTPVLNAGAVPVVTGVKNSGLGSDPMLPAPVNGAANQNTAIQNVMTGNADRGTEPTADLAAQLNAMTVGGGAVVSGKNTNTDTGASVPGMGIMARVGSAMPAAGYVASFLAAQNGYQPQVESGGASEATASPVSSTSMGGDDLDAVMLEGLGGDDGLSSTGLSLDGSLASVPSSMVHADAVGAAVLAGASGASSAVAQAPTVAQAVAAHLQSMAQNRDTRSLTLHLDPPELGRMQVKMSYGRDKSVRADILVEKSDTLRMMEQDRDVLKSALDQAGLQTDAGSLNFSLADQGAFAQSDREATLSRASGADYTIGDGGTDIAAFEFKSSEEWSVDPATGITRYNIVV